MFTDHNLSSLKAVNVSNRTPQPICSFMKRNKAILSLKAEAAEGGKWGDRPRPRS